MNVYTFRAAFYVRPSRKSVWHLYDTDFYRCLKEGDDAALAQMERDVVERVELHAESVRRTRPGAAVYALIHSEGDTPPLLLRRAR